MPNGIRIRSAVFPQCTGQTDRPTDRSRESLMTIGRYATTATRPNHHLLWGQASYSVQQLVSSSFNIARKISACTAGEGLRLVTSIPNRKSNTVEMYPHGATQRPTHWSVIWPSCKKYQKARPTDRPRPWPAISTRTSIGTVVNWHNADTGGGGGSEIAVDESIILPPGGARITRPTVWERGSQPAITDRAGNWQTDRQTDRQLTL